MGPGRSGPSSDATATGRLPGRLMPVGALMALIAGVAFGSWLFCPPFNDIGEGIRPGQWVLIGAAAILGGLSAAGVPLLLVEKRRAARDRRATAWGGGRLLWFSAGASAWLLWPPIVATRLQGNTFDRTTAGLCFAYGTPLMALYVTLALLAGGWLRRRRRRRAARSWQERFGLLLGLAWACTGLYVLSLVYRDELVKF